MSALAADAVFVNGVVVTVDDRDTVASALAVKGESIIAVGSDQEILDLAGPSTETFDLSGRPVLPGINDCHMHSVMAGLNRPPLTLDCSFPAVKTIAEIRAAVAARARESAPGEWIRGAGWDEGYLEECLADGSRHLTRHDLDEAAPHHPVCLVSATVHELVANSRAMELAGVTQDTEAPPGSAVVRDPSTGALTGRFLELPAEALITRAIPPWTSRQKRDAVLAVMGDLNRRGITSITDAALGPGGGALQGGALGVEGISIYNDLANADALRMRVTFLYLFGEYGAISIKDFEDILPLLGVHSGFGSDWLQLGGIKLFADGVPQAKTAWMHDEYPGGGNGSLVMPGATDVERREELIGLIACAHRHGFQCGIHAIGGAAIEACVDGFVAALDADPRPLRHYLIHSDFITDNDIARCVRYDIGVATQPILKAQFSDVMDAVFGVAVSERQWPLRSLLDAGCHVSASSDAPVVEPDWLLGVEAAVTRRSRATGTVRGPDQRISVKEAIRLYTMGGAWQDHMERRKGSLEVGKLADLCVLDRDILTVAPEEIHTLRNVATVVGGRLVFDEGLE
jgi:predicted amidohydrolase YtcJ